MIHHVVIHRGMTLRARILRFGLLFALALPLVVTAGCGRKGEPRSPGPAPEIEVTDDD